MPKLKSKRASKKRFKITGGGKIKHGQAYKTHMATKKSRSRKNKLKKTGYTRECDVGLVLRCQPYR